MARLHGFVAGRAEKNLFEWGRARVVDEQRGRLPVGSPTIAPAHECDESRRKIHTFGRQSVFVAVGPLLVLDLVQDVAFDQPGQPVGQQVASNPQVVLQLTEAMNASEDVTHDQQRPAITDEVERCFDRARAEIGGVGRRRG